MSKERSKPVHVFGGPDYEVGSIVISYFVCVRLMKQIWERKEEMLMTELMKKLPCSVM